MRLPRAPSSQPVPTLHPQPKDLTIIGAVRQDKAAVTTVSSVDNAQTPMGLASVVLALAQQETEPLGTTGWPKGHGAFAPLPEATDGGQRGACPPHGRGGCTGCRGGVRRRHARPERSRQPWARTNHAGRPVTLLEGPAHAAGLATGAVLAGPPTMVAAVAAASLGALDDLVGNTTSKGLKGHLRAAAQGQVTTGLLKDRRPWCHRAVTVALADRRPRSTRWAGSAPDSAADTAAYSTGVTSTLVGGAAVTRDGQSAQPLRPPGRGGRSKVGMLVATPMVLRPPRSGSVRRRPSVPRWECFDLT